MKNILIVGYGNIGKHMYSEFEPLTQYGFQIDIYDKYKSEVSNKQNITYDIAFICVPTDNNEKGEVQITDVEDAIKNTNANVIVIKSTIPVGSSQYFKETYNTHLVFSPEYYGTTIHSLQKPNFVVLAGDKSDMEQVANLYYKIKDRSFRIKFTDYKTAELVKYMENCFLGLKV